MVKTANLSSITKLLYLPFDKPIRWTCKNYLNVKGVHTIAGVWNGVRFGETWSKGKTEPTKTTRNHLWKVM